MRPNRASLYQRAGEKVMDILAANCNVHIRLERSKSGGIDVVQTSDYEKGILLVQQAEALARLAIDAAMTK